MKTLIPEKTAINRGHSYSTELVTAQLQSTPDFYALDYGCGTGRNIAYMLDNSHCTHIYGTDTLEQILLQKTSHDTLRDRGIAILTSQAYPDNFFDIILNSFVLNVVTDDIKKTILADIYRLLREGGTAVIEVRTKKDIDSIKSKTPSGDGYIVSRGSYSTYQEAVSYVKLEALCTEIGFKIEAHHSTSTKHIITVSK